MNFSATIVAFAAVFISALEALTISSPTAGQTFYSGTPVPVLVSNDVGETYTIAQVTFASPFGSWVGILPVGVTQYVNLPCEVVDTTYIVARAGAVSSAQTSITVLPGPCGNPCMDPCVDPCANPCPRSSRRHSKHNHHHSSKNCRLYSEEAAAGAEEFVAPLEQQINAEAAPLIEGQQAQAAEAVEIQA